MRWTNYILSVLLWLSVAGGASGAIVERWFSTAAAGDGDGTSWANRAQLVNGATWSTVFTTYDFEGSGNSMACYIGPGTHTYAANLQATTFTGAGGTAPTKANSIIFQGCDSSGNPLAPTTPEWTSDQSVYDDSGFPILASTGNYTLALPNSIFRCTKFTASGRQGAVLGTATAADWCTVYNSTNNANAGGIGTAVYLVTNSYVYMSGENYAYGVNQTGGQAATNVRIQGVTGSGGTRHGYVRTSTSGLTAVVRVCSFGHGGCGFASGSNSTVQAYALLNCTFANNGSDGIQGYDVAEQTQPIFINACQITGNGGYNVNFQGQGNVTMTKCRMRDGALGNINTDLLNYPITFDNYTTDTDDATEYVDAANGDYRINSDAATFGLGYGVGGRTAVTLPTVGNVLTGAGTFGYADNALTPTLTLPDAADVWFGTGTYGNPGSAVTPLMRASDIANCEAGNIKDGVVIDDVTGTYAGGGGAIDFPDFCQMWGI